MLPERWQQVRDVFERVVDLDAEGRAIALDRLCHDDHRLRREVESLLDETDGTDARIPEIIGAAAAGVVGATDRQPVAVPKRIGPYRVVELLGSGGMGSVYLAERDDRAVHHRVALKVLRRDPHDAGMAARFRSEQQILADLRHPNIARLIDGGATEDGTPYLAMEHVDGEHIDTWCDGRRLGVEARIDLFREVCGAVQAAHRSLVVHRDLKPANILVTSEGHPKLLDFGIAKILGASANDHTVVMTRTMERLLTPAFASPEQVFGQPVTTASDVYSLGVVLYELLTGTTPHEFADGSATEIERVVCREDPDRPSVAVRRRAGIPDGAAAAADRGLSPDRLARRLAGDLDTIVMTALRKEPERRYPSVEALSEDLRRHLARLPVKARPDTMSYRVSKFVGRHRTAVAAVVVGVLGVLAFGIQATVSARVAVQERDRARTAEERARVEAQTAERVSTFLVDLFRVADPGESRGEEISVRELLDRGAARLEDELADEPVTRARLLTSVGEVYRNLGEYEQAAAVLGESVDLLQQSAPDGPELTGALNRLAGVHLDLGDMGASHRLTQLALEAARRTYPGDHPETARALANLGTLANQESRLDDAERWTRAALDMRVRLWGDEHPEVADSLYDLGTVALNQFRLDEAVELHERAYDMRRRVLGADHPVTMSTLATLVGTLESHKQFERGLERIDEIMPTALGVLGPDHPDIGYLEVMRGRQYRFLQRTEEAEAAFTEALRIERATRGRDHPNVAYAHLQIGAVQAADGRLDAADQSYRDALEIYERAFPDGDIYTANTLSKLAELAILTGDGDDALELARRSREMFGRLLPPHHEELVQGDALVARSLAAAGHTTEARERLEAVLPTVVTAGGEDCRDARLIRQALHELPPAG